MFPWRRLELWLLLMRCASEQVGGKTHPEYNALKNVSDLCHETVAYVDRRTSESLAVQVGAPQRDSSAPELPLLTTAVVLQAVRLAQGLQHNPTVFDPIMEELVFKATALKEDKVKKINERQRELKGDGSWRWGRACMHATKARY